jgi:hypothetical protein
MPEELWREASEAARSWGVSRVGTALKVGYATLRQRSGVEGVRKAARDPEHPVPAFSGQFVELSNLSPIHEVPHLQLQAAQSCPVRPLPGVGLGNGTAACAAAVRRAMFPRTRLVCDPRHFIDSPYGSVITSLP